MTLTKTVIALVLCSTLVLAQEPQGLGSRPSSDSVKTQIKNLDNDAFDVRTKAMESLRAAGEDARTDLEAAKKSQSLEVRTRAETLLKELDDKKAGGAKLEGLRPVNPEEQTSGETRERTAIRGGQVPRPEDFPDPNAYADAIRKWMDERMKNDRFPTFVLPDGRQLERNFKDFTVITPGRGTVGSGSFSYAQIKDGEKMTYKSNADRVTIEIEKKDENGKPLPPETYTAKDTEEFKAKYPEVWEKYKPMEMGGLNWRVGGGQGQVMEIGPQGGARTWAPIAPTPATPGWSTASPKIDLNAPKLGVMTSPVPPVLDRQLKLKGEGVVIDSVFPDSLASRLGLRELDVLVSLDGQVVRDRDDLLRVLTQKDPPATATAKVMREGAPVELSAPRGEKAK
jgi:PDZ domain